ncbi:MAG: response regulator [Phycisphaerae bacterium]|nr:response regulator [Phycisphaerae bacterium]
MALNILVVDDSATTRTMVARTLAMGGVPIGQVHQASNGREGLDTLDRERIDIVFVDINMPVMNGIEMIDTLRQKPELAAMPIVVISTESSETRIDEVRRKGVEFIHKPFTPERVHEVMQSLLGEFQHADTEADARF